jgi:serine/threonine protein kinase
LVACDAHRYMHRLSICHRDIKMENIVLMEDGVTVKLLDFGTAKLCTEAKTAYIGTFPYMSPELKHKSIVHDKSAVLRAIAALRKAEAQAGVVIPDGGYDGKAADMWSLGILLFVMSTGYLPFGDQGIDVTSTPLKHAEAQVDEANFFPTTEHSNYVQGSTAHPLVYAILRKLLHGDPSKRLSSSMLQQDPWLMDQLAREPEPHPEREQ